MSVHKNYVDANVKGFLLGSLTEKLIVDEITLKQENSRISLI